MQTAHLMLTDVFSMFLDIFYWGQEMAFDSSGDACADIALRSTTKYQVQIYTMVTVQGTFLSYSYPGMRSV
jgi:hypothetical protein